MNKIWKEDVASLFEACGIDVAKPLLATFNEATYEFDRNLKANWLYFAFLAFKLMAKSIVEPELVAVSGVGSGLDGIALYETLRPRRLHMIDINPDVIPIASSNLKEYFGKVNATMGCEVVHGNLLASLQPESADLVYSNIPTIPSSGQNVLEGMNSSTFYDPAWAANSPAYLKHRFLGLQYEWLRQSKIVLKPNKPAVMALGVRTSASVVNKLYAQADFPAPKVLIAGIKEQSQPELVVGAYARQEQEQGVEFDFYRPGIPETEPVSNVSLVEFKDSVRPWRISANEALQLSRQRQKVYHVVAILLATK